MLLTSQVRRPGRILALVAVLLAASVAAGAGVWLGKWANAVPDMNAVLTANNRGIGYMEQFKYPEAIKAFEEVVRRAPNWDIGRINLGIALLNQHGTEDHKRAIYIFEQILQKDPDNPYAHYCLGIIFAYLNQPSKAADHFKEVTRIDPGDAQAWYRLGRVLEDNSQARFECYERAVKLDPYLNSAMYGYGMELRTKDINRARQILAEQEALKENLWFSGPQKDIRYSEMGQYAAVIGRMADSLPPIKTGPIPLFADERNLRVKLRPGARWASAADFGKGTIADLRRQIRERFGAVMVVFDFNRDGKLDLFMLGAVVVDGKVEDLLLRNNGGGEFIDSTIEAGLAGPRPSTGCCIGDFDNNGYPDIFITGIGEQRLFRNTGMSRFEDVTAQAGLDQLKTVCLGSAFLDLDQDGDLDLVVAQYAETPAAALMSLKADKAVRGPGLAVFINVGEAKPASPSEDPPPLTPRFQRSNGPAALLAGGLPVTSLAFTDLDGDLDMDLFVLADQAAPEMIFNDRLLRFHSAKMAGSLVPPGRWNGALVLDANQDGRTDLLVVGPAQSPLLLLGQVGAKEEDKLLQKGNIHSPPLIQAQAIDLDLDGWTDIVGLSDQRKPVLLHNRGRQLALTQEGLGPDAEWPADLIAVVAADFTGDGLPDIMVWSESKGLQLRANQGNGNYALLLDLVGHRKVHPRGEPSRCNADGFGTVVKAMTGDQQTSVEYSTLSAGLGQSRQPIVLGLGRHVQPDVMRLLWPDNVTQAEFNRPIGQAVTLHQDNRKGNSCPVLFAWNGQRFGFITDFLGAGTMGEMQPQGDCRPPRPEESIKIEAEQLVPLDGHYFLKVADPMDEVIYLDRLQLLVLDHPADVRVYPDERFAFSGPGATQDLLAFRNEIFPVRARDQRGQDVTEKLRAWDRNMVDDFRQRAWSGYAEEHWVELDFGDRLAKIGPNDPMILCLAGWTDYPYPESIWAATQAGIVLLPPVLEKRGPDGTWQSIIADAGLPAGLPRMMTLDVTGKVYGPSCVVRLRTNMQIFWDQIFLAPLAARMPAATAAKGETKPSIFRVTPLEVADATLAARSSLQEFSPDGRKPTMYDYNRFDSVPFTRLAGKLTRTGDVTELLRARDDRFAIFGPGDEVTARFDAGKLPALPPGWRRSFVLRTWGYSKDCGPFTATGTTIEPLPFERMSNYPYGPTEQYPRDREHDEYQQKFNTRQVGPVQRLSKPVR